MPRIDRRLQRLTVVAARREELSERDESFLRWLSWTSLAVVLRETAKAKATRRWLAEHGRVAGRPLTPVGRGWLMTPGDGWHWDTDEGERERLTQRELDDLLDLTRSRSLHSAVRAWLMEAETNGWPVLRPPPDNATYDPFVAFRERLAQHRAMMAVHRTFDDALVREWRRANPEWHPDMGADDLDRWELRG
jgi:hypothetical protein